MVTAFCELSSDACAYLQTLYAEKYPQLWRLACLIIHDEKQAEDIVSNAILSLFSLVPKLQEMDDVKRIAYLRATIRNAAYKQYNAQKRRNLSEFAPSDSLLFSLPGPVDDDPAKIAIKNEEYRMVREAIATLPEADRQALYFKYSAGLTSREIAEMTNAPSENAVNIRLSRARHKVLLLLEDWGWERG